jgi:hypothetical protein
MVATVTDAVTGIRLRGRHSNRSSSTAIRTDASGAFECGGHPAGRSCHQQCLALVRGQVQEVRRQRAHSAARHDDRPLGPERPAGSDRDRRGHRLEHRDPGRYPAAAGEDRLDGLRHAMAADLLAAVPRHQPDQPQQAVRRDRARGPDGERDRGDQQRAAAA